jgi:pilus assembly protein CpaD
MTMNHRNLFKASRHVSRVAGLGLVAALGIGLSGCAGIPANRTMYSEHQPVVEKVNYTLDLTTGPGGLSYPEQERLAGWFQELGLRFGDRLSVQDPTQDPSTLSAIDALASRYGITADMGVPASAGFVEAGTARVVISRSKAYVPGCPDWSDQSDANPANALSRNFGCATNSNLAAMVADPNHLLKGDDSGSSSTITTATKAVNSYRNQAPTGAGGIRATSSRDQ